MVKPSKISNKNKIGEILGDAKLIISCHGFIPHPEPPRFILRPGNTTVWYNNFDSGDSEIICQTTEDADKPCDITTKPYKISAWNEPIPNHTLAAVECNLKGFYSNVVDCTNRITYGIEFHTDYNLFRDPERPELGTIPCRATSLGSVIGQIQTIYLGKLTIHMMFCSARPVSKKVKTVITADKSAPVFGELGESTRPNLFAVATAVFNRRQAADKASAAYAEDEARRREARAAREGREVAPRDLLSLSDRSRSRERNPAPAPAPAPPSDRPTTLIDNLLYPSAGGKRRRRKTHRKLNKKRRTHKKKRKY